VNGKEVALPSAKPWQVWVTGGSIHSGHDTETQAARVVTRCNEKAKELGLKTRYEARAKS
jgi:hypothetical protein